jgi:hypothetical protein
MLIDWSQYDVSDFKLRTVVLLRQFVTKRCTRHDRLIGVLISGVLVMTASEG